MYSSTTAQTSAPSLDFKFILDIALREYEKKTGKPHPLATELKRCDSVDSIIAILLRGQGEAFEQRSTRDGEKGLMKWISPTKNALNAFSNIFGVRDVVDLVRQ